MDDVKAQAVSLIEEAYEISMRASYHMGLADGLRRAGMDLLHPSDDSEPVEDKHNYNGYM